MRIKFDFSHVHIHAAKALSLEVREIEAALDRGEEEKYSKGEIPARIIHDGYATNAVISSTAFLEASINEFFDKMMTSAESWEEAAEDYSSQPVDQAIVNQTMLGLRDVHPGWFPNKGTLKKYQLLLVYAGREPFETGEGIYQNVNTVRKMRNELVHFEPEWYDSEEEIGTPGSLPGSLELNPFYETTRDPESYLSHAVVDWSIEACAEFVLEFYTRMGVEHTAVSAGIDRILNEE